MRGSGSGCGNSAPRLRGPAYALVAAIVLSCGPPAVAGPEASKLVIVIYPDESDGAPGIVLVNRALRSTFASESPEHVENRNEYVDTARLRDPEFVKAQVSVLRQKYAGRKVDLVVAGLSSGVDFVLGHRDELFPRVPVVFVAVDQREVKARRLPPDMIGVPIRMDLGGTLDLALRLHPDTRRVYVVAGAAPFDTEWEAEARRTFHPREDRLEFVYLTGLPMDDLLRRVAGLPERSIIYYLHINRDGAGEPFFPSTALERLAAKANAPIYGHVDTYVGRGAVGGRVFTFETEGASAARLGLRILAGEKVESIPVTGASENTDLFDYRQLRRWGIDEGSLPPGSVVRYKELSFWDVYRWHVIGVVSLCIVEALLIAGLLIQRAKRRRSEVALREGQQELRSLTGRLLEAQEAERRRIARELHDDLNQSLAFLALELDLLGQDPATTAEVADRVQELSARVKELSAAVHGLSHQLHPSKLEQLGLVAALGGLCKELTQSHGLEVKFTHHPGLGVVPSDAALCLYRIAQEALRNVAKHSRSRHASVELSGTADAVRLRVADDGAGFDPGSAAGNGGLGLVSMRERLNLVGGEIAIDSRPSGGTRIDVHVPVATSQPAPRRSFTGAPGGGMMGSPSPGAGGHPVTRPRVLLADDHRMLREAFARLLEADCDVVGSVADGRALLAAASDLRPDIVVLDIAMPLLNGLDAARQLKRDMPGVKVIFLTMNEDPDVAAEAFRVGGSGYLLKNSAASELLQAIREVSRGRSYVTPLATRGLVDTLIHPAEPAVKPAELSPRQREVLQLLAEGHTMKETARLLKITRGPSPSTSTP
jgi:signal transduction histidine kinase/DNA-binding NarL/FixJ family response regulator